MIGKYGAPVRRASRRDSPSFGIDLLRADDRDRDDRRAGAQRDLDEAAAAEALQPVALGERLAGALRSLREHHHEVALLEQAHRVVGRGDHAADAAHEGAHPRQAEGPVEHHEARVARQRVVLLDRDAHHRRVPRAARRRGWRPASRGRGPARSSTPVAFTRHQCSYMNSKQRIDDLDQLLVEAPLVLRVVAAQPARGAARDVARRPGSATAARSTALGRSSPGVVASRSSARKSSAARAASRLAARRGRAARLRGRRRCARRRSTSRRSRRARSCCVACRSSLTCPPPPAAGWPAQPGSDRRPRTSPTKSSTVVERGARPEARPPRSAGCSRSSARSAATAPPPAEAAPGRAAPPAPSAAPNSGAGTGSGSLPASRSSLLSEMLPSPATFTGPAHGRRTPPRAPPTASSACTNCSSGS